MGDVKAQSLATGNVDALGNPNDGINGLTLAMSSHGGIGTYGQFALGTAAILGNTGWLGYGRVDYRIGDNIESWSVNAGLRYQFTPAGRTSIKDDGRLPTYTYNWSGSYIGLYLGSAWGGESWSANNGAGPGIEPDFAGTIGGGQVGYNHQFGRTVVGIEGDYGFSNARGGVSCPNLNFYTCEADLERLAMLTGRVGVTWGRALFYGKGGVVAGEVTAGTKLNTPSNPFGPLPFADPASDNEWRVGWTVGGGMEFALTDRWSARAEYMHYDLGSETFTTFEGDPGTRVDSRGNIARIGVNLHLHPVQREVLLK
jgi:opacity protein-like surface antigen